MWALTVREAHAIKEREQRNGINQFRIYVLADVLELVFNITLMNCPTNNAISEETLRHLRLDFDLISKMAANVDLEMYILQGYTFAKLPMPLKQVLFEQMFIQKFTFGVTGPRELETRVGKGCY